MADGKLVLWPHSHVTLDTVDLEPKQGLVSYRENGMESHNACEVIEFFRNYRPQRSCEGYVFTCVCHSVHRGCYSRMHCRWYPNMPCSRSPGGCLVPGGGGCLVLGGAWSRGCVERPLESRWLLLRTVHILLECILVRSFCQVCQKCITVEKIKKKNIVLARLEPSTLGLSVALTFSLIPCHCARSDFLED